MKGVIFNVFEQFISENFGEDRYEEILEATALQTQEPFVGPGTYPDQDMLALVGTATEQLGISVPQAMRAFGAYAFPKLAQLFPNFVSPYTDPKEFLKTVDGVIHVEVRKLYPDALTPVFKHRDTAPHMLIMEYHSPRQICHLMEGLLDGVAQHFGVPIVRHQLLCTHQGAPHCEFELDFRPQRSSAE